jgi:hypothetical protein
MGDVVMFKRNKPGKAKADAGDTAPEKSATDVVILPGIDLKALAGAWAYYKKTGKTHAGAPERKKKPKL